MTRNGLGNTDEKYLPYAVLKVQPSDGPVAQLVRAPPCHGGGRGFESHPGRLSIWIIFILWDLSSAGRASALQAEGHRFEPCRSHLQQKCCIMDGFPSGQRGQTVNLLQIASVVRIHLHPLSRCGSIGRAADL